MDYSKACKALYSRLRIEKKDLSVFSACLARLGNPQNNFRAVHIAGTNGKGSVSALTAEICKTAGFKTGLYISPHLIDLRERISVNGRMISKETAAKAIARVLAAETKPLTFFEILTAAAFLHFSEQKVDIAVIEAGIGGRLDCTNAIKNPLVSVITSVALDHTEILGDTIQKIAREKAGIIKPGAPCVCGALPKQAYRELALKAKSRGVPLINASTLFKFKKIDWNSGATILADKDDAAWRLALTGRQQAVNAGAAYKTALLLREIGFDIKTRHIREAFSRVKWNCRFQLIRRNNSIVIIDGGHNREAVRNFIATFKSSPFRKEPFSLVIGLMKEKEYRAIAAEVGNTFKKIIVTRPPSARALDPVILADAIAARSQKADIEVCQDCGPALRLALSGGNAAVAGSLYLAGAALKFLNRRI